MSNTPLPEPDSRWHPSWGLPSTYSADQMHAHAAAVSAADNADIQKLYLDAVEQAAANADEVLRLRERIKVLRNALSECYGALPTDTDGDFLREIRAALGDKNG
jgi:CHAD domain-containing protein